MCLLSVRECNAKSRQLQKILLGLNRIFMSFRRGPLSLFFSFFAKLASSRQAFIVCSARVLPVKVLNSYPSIFFSNFNLNFILMLMLICLVADECLLSISGRPPIEALTGITMSSKRQSHYSFSGDFKTTRQN